MPAPDDSSFSSSESRERWLRSVHEKVVEQIMVCRERLDSVAAALEEPAHGGALPVEARAFFAAEAGVDLVGDARYLQRARASCGDPVKDGYGGPALPLRCLRASGHQGECDADLASLAGPIRAHAVSLLRSMMVVAGDLAEIELLLDQAAAHGVSPLSAEDRERLGGVADKLERLGDEMWTLCADVRRLGERLVHTTPSSPPSLDRAAMPARRPAPDASAPGLGGPG